MKGARFVAAFVLALVIAGIYWPILGNGFVWDDGANLIGARQFWDSGLAGVRWAFTEPFFGHYQPLTWLSYQLDSRVSGATPRGVHATQIGLHLLVTLGVGLLAAVVARSPGLAHLGALRGFGFPWLAAAFFGLAAVRVESVAWATERRDLLGALFTIAALLLYLRTSPEEAAPALGARLAVAGLAAASALARAQMTLPLVLLLLDVFLLRRLAIGAGFSPRQLGRRLAEKLVLWAIAAASAVAAIWAQASSGALTSVVEHGYLERLVQAFYGLAIYPLKAFLPQVAGPFLPLYERPAPFPFWAPEYLLPALGSATALVVLFFLRRRWPLLVLAVGAYLLLVLPVLGIAQSGIQLVADRYAYLATIPLVLWVAGALFELVRRQESGWVRAGIVVLLASSLGSQAFLSWRQTAVWQDDASLWRHVLAHSESSLADNNYGQLLYGRGESGKALFHLTRCLEASPEYGRPWAALAAILEAPWPEGAPPAEWVASTLAKALTHQSGLGVARYATALAFLRQGDADRAEKELRRLLAVEKEHDGARLALFRLEAAREGTRR